MIDIVLASDVGGTFYSSAASAGWAWSSPYAWNGTEPQARLIPESYSVIPSGTYSAVTVNIFNQGTATAKYSYFMGLLIPLDDQDRGLLWKFLSENPSSSAGQLDAGATRPLQAPYYGFPGSALKAYARVDAFEDCSTCLVSAPDLNTPEGIWRFHRDLQEAEERKQRRLGY